MFQHKGTGFQFADIQDIVDQILQIIGGLKYLLPAFP